MRSRWILRLGFSLAAGLVSLWSSQAIYRDVPTGADENSYLFQAQLFSEGRYRRPPPPLKEVFQQEMIILDDRAGWLSRYSPGHPLWLVPGVWLGEPQLMIALAAALGMWFACAAAAALGVAELFIAVPLLLSPFFICMYGTLLSHTSGLAATACLLWAYVRWRTGGHWGFALLAGLAWSFFFLNRTYTALLMALPLGVDALWVGVLQRTRRRWVGVLVFAGAAGLGLLVYLAYNRLTTGDALLATYLYYEPSEGLGFGPRRTQGLRVEHTLAKGIANLVANVRLMNLWWLGFNGSLVVWALLGIVGLSRRYSLLLASMVAAVWLGYVYFWFPGVLEAGGPVYFFETIPMLLLLGGLGLQRVWRRAVRWPRRRWLVGVLAMAALGFTSVRFLLREGPARAAVQQVKRDLRDVLAGAPEGAMVILEDVRQPHIGEIVFNPKGLASDPLLLKSMYVVNPVSMRAFAERQPFLLRGDQQDRLQPLTPPQRIVLERDAATIPGRTGGNVGGGAGEPALRVAGMAPDPADFLVLGTTFPLPRGSYDVRVTGTLAGVPEDFPVTVDVVYAGGRQCLLSTNLAVNVASNLLFAGVLTINERVLRVEPRVYYGGSGTVTVTRIGFYERR